MSSDCVLTQPTLNSLSFLLLPRFFLLSKGSVALLHIPALFDFVEDPPYLLILTHTLSHSVIYFASSLIFFSSVLGSFCSL